MDSIHGGLVFLKFDKLTKDVIYLTHRQWLSSDMKIEIATKVGLPDTLPKLVHAKSPWFIHESQRKGHREASYLAKFD